MLTAFLYPICSSLMSAPCEENKFTKFVKKYQEKRFFKEAIEEMDTSVTLTHSQSNKSTNT